MGMRTVGDPETVNVAFVQYEDYLRMGREVEATCAALKVALAESTWMVMQRDADTDTIEALQAERDAMRPDAERWRVHVKRLEAFRQIKIDAQTTLP